MPQRTLFDGPDVTPVDAPRLSRQLGAVAAVMCSGNWYTLAGLQLELAKLGVNATTQSISARVRDLRKWRHGGHTIERENMGGGLFRYRMKR